MFKTIQLYAAIAAVIIVLLLGFGLNHFYKKTVKLENELKSVSNQLINAQADIKTQEFSAKFSNWVNSSYLKTTEEIRNENDTLKRDVATGKRKLYANATCVQSNVTITGDTGSSVGAAPRFTPAAEQGLLDLREGIPINAKQYELAITTLNYWHDNWYALCGAKEK